MTSYQKQTSKQSWSMYKSTLRVTIVARWLCPKYWTRAVPVSVAQNIELFIHSLSGITIIFIPDKLASLWRLKFLLVSSVLCVENTYGSVMMVVVVVLIVGR